MGIISRYSLKPGFVLLLLAFAAFISLGMPDALLGMAWPSFRKQFGLPLDSLGLLLAAGVGGYLLSTFFTGRLMSKIGVGKLLVISCFMTSAACSGFALSPVWIMTLPVFFTAGLGSGAIDAGLNTYAAENFSGSHMQWLHASYGIGITTGPVIMTIAINYLDSWKWGYIIVSGFQFLLAVSFTFTASLWMKNKKEKHPHAAKSITEYKTPIGETLKEYRVWISIFIFFVYTGIEGTMSSWAYTLLIESRGISTEAAGYIVGVFFASFTIGRIMGGFFAKRIEVHKLLKVSMLTAFAGALLLALNPFKMSSLAAVIIVGFSIAPVFPGMVSLTAERVGDKFAANTVGMQMSAAGLGIAVVPSLTGILARNISLEVIPLLVIFCTAVVFLLQSIVSNDFVKKVPSIEPLPPEK